jgi:hypothetical protein
VARKSHHTPQVGVTAKRHHVGQLVLDRVAARGRHRQPAGEADPDETDLAVRGVRALLREPGHRVLDRVGRVGRDAVRLQVRQGDRHHGEAGGGQLPGQRGQAAFLDAGRVDARNDDDRVADRLLGNVEARGDVAMACRHHVHRDATSTA